jgi:hypothetical protein
MAAESPENPYVGPRPFEREDAACFFGRTREIRDVVSLVTAQRVLLLYAPSGAGKSSLLSAGVLPVLEEERGADVLPVARVRAEDGSPSPPLRNVFVSALLMSLGAERDAAFQKSLRAFLRERPRTAATDAGLRVLVIDQLEELFTTQTAHWQQRAGVFSQLRRALALDPALRVVLSIREEFEPQLDPFVTLLPGGLRTRFRLDRLQRAAALRAVTGPLELTPRSYADGAAERLVDDLLKTRVDATDDQPLDVEGEFVEPVQLQVVCHRLWSQLPGNVMKITEEDLRAFGDVDEVLTELYEDAVRNAVTSTGVREQRLRRWIDRTLLTPSGLRSPVVEGDEATAGMSNRVLRVLEDGRVIRAESWGRVRLYELTHDRIIRPVQRANARYRGRRRRRQQRLAGIGAVLVALFAAGLVVPFVLLRNEEPASATVSTELTTHVSVTLTQSGTASVTVLTTTYAVSTTVRATATRTVTTIAPGTTVTIAESTVTTTLPATTVTVAESTVTTTLPATTVTVPLTVTGTEPPP